MAFRRAAFGLSRRQLLAPVLHNNHTTPSIPLARVLSIHAVQSSHPSLIIPSSSQIRTLHSTLPSSSSDDGVGGHDDFSRVVKHAPGNAEARIKEQLAASKVVLYMKGSPSAPSCGFSWKTARILQALQVPFTSFDVLQDRDIRQGIKLFSAWPTIPQLYIDGEFIGGADIVETMARNGELQTALEKAGAYETKAEQ